MGKIRSGVLGASKIAVTRVLPAMAQGPGVELAAVASRSLDKAVALCADAIARTASAAIRTCRCPGR